MSKGLRPYRATRRRVAFALKTGVIDLDEIKLPGEEIKV
jgi:hypothetical protein